MKILGIYDSYIKKIHFERGLEKLKEKNEISLIELDESKKWNAEEGNETIKEYHGSPEQFINEVKNINILLVHLAPITKKIIGNAKNLKLIGCCRGGPVNVNIKSATKKGIPVVNTPGRNAIAVAELTIGFIFALARKTAENNLRIKEGRLVKNQDFYEGIEINGKTLGIVGLGRVGSEVARRTKALGMNILVYDPYVGEVSKELSAKLVDLETIFKKSDFITLHARLTNETKELISKKLIDLMKKDAYFINTSRAEIVDQKALEEALREKKIVGAALDVVGLNDDFPVNPYEFYTNYHKKKEAPELIKMDNVIITPHIGGLTKETRFRSVEMLADEIERFIKGEKLKNVVNPEVLK
jgi:D-3-phosphoglycerate dehydrogenase